MGTMAAGDGGASAAAALLLATALIGGSVAGWARAQAAPSAPGNMSVLCNSHCDCVTVVTAVGRPASNATTPPDKQQLGSAYEQLVAFSASNDYPLDAALVAAGSAAGPHRTVTTNATGNGDDLDAAPGEAQPQAGNDHRQAAETAPGGGGGAGNATAPAQLDQSSDGATNIGPAPSQSKSAGTQATSVLKLRASADEGRVSAPRALPFGTPSGGGQPAANFRGHHTNGNNNDNDNNNNQISTIDNNPARALLRKQQQLAKDASAFEPIKWRPIATSPLGLLPGELVERLVPLHQLDMSNHRLVSANSTQLADVEPVAGRLVGLLTELEQGQQFEALRLSNNSIEFEQWTEIYALLSAGPMRRRLFQLDLSHNNLVKLGVTFTGYIEHHLQLASVAAANATSGELPRWPFGRATQNATNSSGAEHQLAKSQTRAMRLALGPWLGDGRLFNSVRAKLNASHWSANISSAAAVAPNSSQQQQLQREAQAQYGAAPTLLQLRAIDLSHNKLKWLINDQFRAIRKVQSIRLDHNRLRFIHQQAFNGLESLKFLSLDSNRLQTIYIEQFQTNYNLLALSVSSNYLAYLRAGTFGTLFNLRRLDLSHNKFAMLTNNALIGLESLELLNCSSNQFVNVPSAALHPLQRLKQLDLSENQFTQLAPGAFFHLPVEELCLNRNEQLMSIERGAFWDLPYLKRLALNSNQMLMRVNSQAFVSAGQSLLAIETDECPLLEAEARQLLDNITIAATSRSLQQQQQQNLPQPQQQQLVASNSSSGAEMSFEAAELPSTPVKRLQSLLAAQQQAIAGQQLIGQLGPAGRLAGASKLLYLFGSLALVVVLLKLVLKSTSTRRYLLEARRRRRRVYQSASGRAAGGELGSERSSGSVDSGHERCSTASADGSAADSEEQRDDGREHEEDEEEEACVSCDTTGRDETRSLSAASDSAARHGQVFALCERPHELFSARAQRHQQQCKAEALERDSAAAQVTRTSGDTRDESGAPPAAHDDHGAAAVDDHAVIQADGERAAPGAQQLPFGLLDCPDCRQHSESLVAACCAEQQQQQSRSEAQQNGDGEPGGQQQQMNNALSLIHNQLLAAGYDYGHANCAHFYQSLGPALQLADMTANFVNQMEHHYY